MAVLRSPTPAWREGDSTAHVTRHGRISTTMPAHLKRRGYRATWPAPAEVFGVAGVPSDATVPGGTTIAQNTTTGSLYRKENGVWKSVNGNV